MPLSARAIRVADVWVVEIPSLQLRIQVTDLADVEPCVAAALSARHRASHPGPIRVEITQFLHLDDSLTAEIRQRREAVAHAAVSSRAASG